MECAFTYFIILMPTRCEYGWDHRQWTMGKLGVLSFIFTLDICVFRTCRKFNSDFENCFCGKRCSPPRRFV